MNSLRKSVVILLLSQLALADPVQKALKDLGNPSLEKRLNANSVLESGYRENMSRAQISQIIAALAKATLREKDRFRPGDYARCLMRYLRLGKNPRQDLPLIFPLLSHSSAEVVLYTWAGVAGWTERPLEPAVADKILTLLDHPREQVRINALMWLCKYANLESAWKQNKALNPVQQKAWSRVLEAGQQTSQIRLRTAAIRILLENSALDEARVLALLGDYLLQPKLDEEDYITYRSLDRWLEELGLEAASLAQPLAQAEPLFRERKLLDLYLYWRSLLGRWTPAEKALAAQLVLEADLNEVTLDFVPRLIRGLAAQGSDGRNDLLVLARRLFKDAGFEDDQLLCGALARVGVDSAAADECLRRFAARPDGEHSGLLAAIGASGSQDPAVHQKLRGYLGDKQPLVRQAAAYALVRLGQLKSWDGQGAPMDGLSLGIARQLGEKPKLPPGFVVETGEEAILKQMAGQPDPVWQEFLASLSRARYPFRCWYCRSLAQKEATLASLDLLRSEKLTQEPLAIKLLSGSPDPEVAEAASRCYQSLWPIQGP